MDALKLDENICRFCLKRNVILNWDEKIFEFCGISYKECYYKYTKIDETDSDYFPTNLCEMCANELKNAHMFFERAVESYNFLQGFLRNKQIETNYSDIGVCNSLLKCEIKTLDEDHSTIDKVMQSEDEICSTSSNEKKRIAKNCNAVNNSKGESFNENSPVEPRHFIDIRNFETCAENPLEDQSSKIVNTTPEKSPSTIKTRSKRKKCEPIPDTLEQQFSKSCGNRLSKSTTTKKTGIRRRKRKSSIETLFEQQNTMASSDQNLSETSESKSVLSTTKSAKKSREKYLLMCAYCSLKVEGARKLEKHEATHNENRERTEVCQQCGIKLFTKLALTEHMKIHDKNRKKNHKCEFCEKAFFNKGALNVHRRIHLGLMIKCQICLKEFFRQVDLDKHLLKHSASPLEKNVGKKKYTVQCQYCNKYVLTDKWKEHLAAHQDQPQVKCKICDKKFFARSKCTKHLKQVHHKNLTEYEEFIHYYVDRNERMSSLMMKQQLSVQPLSE